MTAKTSRRPFLNSPPLYPRRALHRHYHEWRCRRTSFYLSTCPVRFCIRASVCVREQSKKKKSFSPISAGTVPFRSLFSRRLTRKSRRGFYYGRCRQTRRGKKNVNPSGSLAWTRRRQLLTRHRINWFISQLHRGLCANLRRYLPHVPIHRSRFLVQGQKTRKGSLTLKIHYVSNTAD